jgi:uncharacterized protein (DUF427 family)
MSARPPEPCRKRLRGYVAGHLVFDTSAATYVWEDRPYPAFHVPLADVSPGVLVPEAGSYTLRLGGEERRDAATSGSVPGAVRFAWTALDSWFEEDQEVFVHPRDPYTRIDVLPSSRRVRVELDGVVLAESTSPHALFETGLPVRWYLPKVDVRMDLLTPTVTSTQCPYKGTAEYWTASVNGREEPDLAWGYATPLPESRLVAGLVCFFNERVDLFVNGELQPRPDLRPPPA